MAEANQVPLPIPPGIGRDIDAELTAPLELPAVSGKPLTTQGGNTLDDGSGNETVTGILNIPGGTTAAPAVHFTSFAPTSGWSGVIGFGLNSDQFIEFDVSGSGGLQVVTGGTVKATITAAGKVNTTPTTPALPANPPVSGTVYQNTTGGPIVITVPITATAIGGSGQWALGSTNTPSDWGGAEQIGVSGEVHNMTLYVPNNWYWSLTVTNATIGTASVLGQ